MFYDFGGKTCFCIFGVTRFSSFGMKTRFFGFRGRCVLAWKYVYSGFAENAFWRKNMFLRFSREPGLAGNEFWWKNAFSVLAGKRIPAEKHVLWFWRENVFLCFGGKTCFGGKIRFGVKTRFCDFGMKTRFCGKTFFCNFGEKNTFLQFCAEMHF